MSWGLGCLENRFTHKGPDTRWHSVEHRAHPPKVCVPDSRIQSGACALHELPGPGQWAVRGHSKGSQSPAGMQDSPERPTHTLGLSQQGCHRSYH